MGCSGCGGSEYNAQGAPGEADPFFWTGTPAETPPSESEKSDKAPSTKKPASGATK